MEHKDIYNETTNTFAGITTPRDREDIAATDPLNEFVKQTMDNLEEAFTGEKPEVDQQDEDAEHTKQDR